MKPVKKTKIKREIKILQVRLLPPPQGRRCVWTAHVTIAEGSRLDSVPVQNLQSLEPIYWAARACTAHLSPGSTVDVCGGGYRNARKMCAAGFPAHLLSIGSVVPYPRPARL